MEQEKWVANIKEESNGVDTPLEVEHREVAPLELAQEQKKVVMEDVREWT